MKRLVDEQDQVDFYPRQKIRVVKDKLNGKNPSQIIAQELKDSKHATKVHYKRLLMAI